MKFSWFKFDYNKKRDTFKDGSWMWEREDEGPPSGNAEGKNIDFIQIISWVTSIVKRIIK